MRTYKGFLYRFNEVSKLLNRTLVSKKKEDYTKEDLFLIAKCYRYIARSYFKMAKINNTVSADSGFSFKNIKDGK